jgi:hypothetical protein
MVTLRVGERIDGFHSIWLCARTAELFLAGTFAMVGYGVQWYRRLMWRMEAPVFVVTLLSAHGIVAAFTSQVGDDGLIYARRILILVGDFIATVLSCKSSL